MPARSAATEMPYTPIDASGLLRGAMTTPLRGLASSRVRWYKISVSRNRDSRYSSSHQPYRQEERTMLVRSDPFREFDRMFAQLVGGPGAVSGPSSMAVDA